MYVTICYDFLILTLIKCNTGCWVMSHGLKVCKGNQNRKVYYSQILEEAHDMYEEAIVGDQGRVQGEREVGAGAQAFTEVPGWSALEFPRLRPIQTKKNRVWVSSMRSNLMGKSPEVRWGAVSQRTVGEVI